MNRYPEQKRDIKVMYTLQQNVTTPVTIYGFESYNIIVGDGQRVKTLVPDVPLTFDPTIREDGQPVAWVADTKRNRAILKELHERNHIVVMTPGVVEEEEILAEESAAPSEITAEFLESLDGKAFTKFANEWKKRFDVKFDKNTTREKATEIILSYKPDASNSSEE